MSEDKADRKGIALCLSGGGLRATLFHLGLIKALRTHKRNDRMALEDVREIYSVSGGSILAAHLVRNWKEYCGNDPQFAMMEKAILAFACRNIRDRILRRWMLAGLFGLDRGFWLKREYRALIGHARIGDCYKVADKPPTLFMLATSFKTGELCSFSHDNFTVMRRDVGGRQTCVQAPGGQLELAYAMAASSAFPPLFPPVRIDDHMLGNPEAEEFRIPLYLSDGGVFDNLGFEMYRLRHEAAKSGPDTLILSNAGGSFRTAIGDSFSGILSRNIRATDILMRRVAENTEAAARQMDGVNCMEVRIGKTVSGDSLPEATQQRLRLVRTDLNTFGPDLAALLIDHGYRVGAKSLTDNGFKPADSLAAPIAKGLSEDLDKVAAAGANLSWRSLFFDLRDGMLLPFLTAIFLILFLFISWIMFGFTNYYYSKNNIAIIRDGIDLGDIKDEQFGNEVLRLFSNFRTTVADQEKEIKELRRIVALGGIGGATGPELSKAPPFNGAAANPPADGIERASYVDGIERASYKVWIQFAGTLKRDEMRAFGKQIKARWPNAPGAEQGGERTEKSAGKLEVRHNPADKAAAEALTKDIEATRVFATMNAPVSLSIIPRGSLEIWVSR